MLYRTFKAPLSSLEPVPVICHPLLPTTPKKRSNTPHTSPPLARGRGLQGAASIVYYMYNVIKLCYIIVYDYRYNSIVCSLLQHLRHPVVVRHDEPRAWVVPALGQPQ